MGVMLRVEPRVEGCVCARGDAWRIDGQVTVCSVWNLEPFVQRNPRCVRDDPQLMFKYAFF